MISVSKKYILWQRPLYKKSSGEAKHLDIPLNAIVYAADETIENGRQLVEYGTLRGWVETTYLEPYVELLPYECADLSDLQTPSETDAAQYINYGGKRIVNACGMISIAYLTGLSLLVVFETWKAQKPAHYRAIERDNFLTYADDLMVILAALGKDSERLRLKRYTPSLITGREIVAVTIDKITGRLSTSGARHWVVPVSVAPDRVGYGTIDIFNPFPNRIERYSWAEFMQSSKLVNGVKLISPGNLP